MLIPGQPLSITVTKTADGKQEYVQILSKDAFSINIVLISPKIIIKDAR